MQDKATIGGGCFWCIEAMFKELKGVSSVISGYAGGNTDNPTYDQMHDGDTGHAEVIQVTFHPGIITYRELLEIFFVVHDPKTLDRQGNDEGPQYRSIILYHNDEQRKTAEDVITNFAQKLWDDPIVTEIKPLNKFWPAEDYHQDFYENNQNVGYCQIIINPKANQIPPEVRRKA